MREVRKDFEDDPSIPQKRFFANVLPLKQDIKIGKIDS